MTVPAEATIGPAGPFEALNARLGDAGIEAELCLVGGAVIILAFDAAPATRHLRALFQPTGAVKRAADQVAREQALPPGWLSEEARRFLRARGPGLGPFLERSNLRVFEPRPEYVLAMKAAAIELEVEREVEADLGYLMRAVGVTTVSAALEGIGRYFSLRQLPDALESRLHAILG